jgi:hypothetical protein
MPQSTSSPRPRIAGPALLLTALAALLIGVTACGSVAAQTGGTQTGDPQTAGPQSAAASTTKAKTPAPAYFGALAGFGCPQIADAWFSEAGWYADGINGFFRVPAGGWTKQGCRGSFDAMPMSGSATKPYPGNYALWTFRTTPVTSGTCQVAVYVPDDHSIEHVGGNPARYQVFDNIRASGTPAGAFTVDERANVGKWVSVGSYPVTDAILTVKLTSAGQDWHGTVVTHAHLAVAQVIISCGAHVPAPGSSSPAARR